MGLIGLKRQLTEKMQEHDPAVQDIVVFSKAVTVYYMEKGPKQTWKDACVDGPLQIVRRSEAPHWVLQVQDQASVNALVDSLHRDWRVDFQEHFIVYHVE